MAKKVIIIGAGISGLSAGCYAAMNGYDVEIHEAHTMPGGLCTTWKRNGYVLDGCIHWLTGSAPGAPFYQVYEELGAVQGRRMYDHEVFASVAGRDGRTLHWYTDIDRLEAHLKELAPADAKPVHELCDVTRRLSAFNMADINAGELAGFLDGVQALVKMRPFMKDFMDVGALTMGALAERFSDPFLRCAVANTLLEETMPAFALIMTLGPMSKHQAGFPLGGSLEFARAIERRFTRLGGKVVYKSRVAQVVERNGRAVGVRLAEGGEVAADYVIAACDLRHALYSLLDGSRVDPLHRELLETGRLYSPAVLVTFGANMDFSSDISCMGTSYELEQPVELAGRRVPFFNIKNFCYDPSFAPPGKSVVGTFLATDWSYWEPLIADRQAYDAEKEKLAAVCQEQIERRHPGFGASVEVVDVATPHTFERYTGNWQGVYMTFILSGDFQRKHRYVPKAVPGLSGFYISSMWTNPPGGIPGAAVVGRKVIQLLCHEDRKRFVASKP